MTNKRGRPPIKRIETRLQEEAQEFVIEQIKKEAVQTSPEYIFPKRNLNTLTPKSFINRTRGYVDPFSSPLSSPPPREV